MLSDGSEKGVIFEDIGEWGSSMIGFVMMCFGSWSHCFGAVLVGEVEKLFLEFKDVIVKFGLFVFELVDELIELWVSAFEVLDNREHLLLFGFDLFLDKEDFLLKVLHDTPSLVVVEPQLSRLLLELFHFGF